MGANYYVVPQAIERLFLVAICSSLEDVKFYYLRKTYGIDYDKPFVTTGVVIPDLPKVEVGEKSTYY